MSPKTKSQAGTGTPRRKFLRIAKRLFPNALSFPRYIEELNSHIQDPSQRICLEHDQQFHPSYSRLLDRLYVAWPREKDFPSEIATQFTSSGSISIDQIIQNVITSALRRYPSRYEAQRHNVLCNGFSLGSQHGKGSVFRNLDLRSSSSQIQLLRSPAWKQLLQCIGAALFSHLLTNNILLLAVMEETEPSVETPELLVPHPTSSVFLQICGAPTTESSKQSTSRLSKTTPSIVLKKDLLYRSSAHGETALNRSTGRLPSMDLVRNNLDWYNSGLPNTHHLQGLSADSCSARRLLSVIFRSCSSRNPPRSERTFRFGPGTQLEQERGDSRMNWPLGSESNMERVNLVSSRHTRGRGWLRERKKFNKRLVGILPILEKVIKRTRKSSFRRLLCDICPLQSVSARGTADQSVPTEVLLQHGTKPKQVATFLIGCFRQIAPLELFGSERNREVFEKAVHNLICRRLKSECFNIHLFSTQSGIVLSDVKWLYRSGSNGKKVSNPTDLAFRQSRIEELFAWLFRGLLLPLTYQNFYVTEGDLHRNRLFYFRTEVWAQLIDATYKSVLRADRKFSVLSKDALTECTLRRENVLRTLDPVICPYPVLIHHELRFVPKRSSLRGIQRCRGKMLRGFSGFKKPKVGTLGARDSQFRTPGTVKKAKTSMKSAFRHILRILSGESHAKARLGASVFSLDDIFVRLFELKQSWLRNKCPSLFVCSVDITTSFDTIPLETLFSEVVPSLLTKERYVALRYGVAKASIATGKLRRRYFIHVCSEPGEEALFSRVVRRKLAPDHAGAVFTDLVQTTTFSRDQILEFLEEFLACNIVTVPRRNRSCSETGFAVQCRGLPQGNQLSPLLTSLFYAHVESHDLAEFLRSKNGVSGSTTHNPQKGRDVQLACRQEDHPCLLMRQVDDTIFFTSNKAKAIQFLKRMVKGWKHTHGFGVNAEKTKTNFKSGLSGKVVEHITWCGLNIDIASLQVRADYTRYGQNEGGCLRDSLFIEHDTMPGTCFAERAWTCFKPKLHPLLLDSRINSRKTVALNLYQAALLACLKLSSYASVILPCEAHLSNVVDVMISKFVELVTRSMCSRTAVTNRCCLPLSQVEVRYIAIHAFHSGIVKKLRRRRRMRKRTKVCVRMLSKNLEELATRVRQQQDSSIERIAKRICETSCKPLWTMRL